MPTLAELAKKGQLHRIAQYLRQELTILDFERAPDALEGRIEQLLHEALDLTERSNQVSGDGLQGIGQTKSQVPNDKFQINSKPESPKDEPASRIPTPKTQNLPPTTQHLSPRPPTPKNPNPKPIVTPTTQHPTPVTPPAMHGEGPSFRWVAESLASDSHPERNEDAWLTLPDASVAAVLDGVGGTAAAAAASTWVATELKKSLATDRSANLADTIAAIGARFINESTSNKTLAGGTTTVAVARIISASSTRKLEFALIGDSRVSIWRPTRNRYELTALDDQLLRLLLGPVDRRPNWLKPLLAKHSLPADIKLEAAEAARLATILDQDPDPGRHDATAKFLFDERAIVTQVIGAPTLTPHSGTVDVEAGDRILLATDGIHDNLTESELIGIVSRTKFEEVASALVVRANEISKSRAPRAKKDDMTAIVLEVL